MSRHSKNANTRAYFTSGEREKEKGVWGTKRARLTEDAQRIFGTCELCLAIARSAVASPYGCLYCRECIVGNLLSQKALLDLKVKRWEEERAKMIDREAATSNSALEAVAADFARAEGGVAGTSRAGGKDGVSQEEKILASKRERMDQRSQHEKVVEAGSTSFWLPASAPGAAEHAMEPPDTTTRCPASGQPMKAKQLIPVNLTLVGSGSSGGAPGGASVGPPFACPACTKPIVYQPALLLTACGHVTCDGCTAKFVVPSKACYVCNVPVVGRAGIVPLQQGGSGHVGHAGTQAVGTKYTPTLLA